MSANFRNDHDQRRRREARRWAMVNALAAMSTNVDPADSVCVTTRLGTIQRRPKSMSLSAADFVAVKRWRAR